MNTSTIDLLSIVIILLMLIVIPLIGIWDWRRLVRWTESGRADSRIKTYNWIFMMKWANWEISHPEPLRKTACSSWFQSLPECVKKFSTEDCCWLY